MHYMLLLTCCQTRAVRIEWLSDLSADAFFLALARARAKGVNPSTLLSDNGTNFTAANQIWLTLWKELSERRRSEELPQVVWKFNPPLASHYGGVFERLIGAAKRALYHAIPDHLTLSLEQLLTAFAHVETALNSRPLTYVSSDELDLTPITPNNFLFGSATIPHTLPLTDDVNPSSLLRRWKQAQEVHRLFWQRFQKEIIPHLQFSSRLAKGGKDPTVGDVVTFLLPTSASRWPLARVAQIFPGKDGRVRTLLLKRPNPNGEPKLLEYRRDVKDVAVLLRADPTL